METNNTKPSVIKETVLRQIRTQELSMLPRPYFILKIVALVVVAVVVALISIFLVNFIAFGIRINSHATLLSFGWRGFMTFLSLFPWPLFVVDIALIVLLQSMLRWFRFGYKIPVLYLLGALLLLIVSSGFLIDQRTFLNDYLLHEAQEHRLPLPLNALYESARESSPDDGVCLCVVEEISDTTLVVRDVYTTAAFTIVLSTETLRAVARDLSIGDKVFVAGDGDEDDIEPFGIQKVPQDTGVR